MLRTLGLAAVASILGLVGAVIGAVVARGLLFELAPVDAASLTAATGVLVVVVLATAYPIARRAGGVDPVEALRSDAG